MIINEKELKKNIKKLQNQKNKLPVIFAEPFIKNINFDNIIDCLNALI